jgi:hypothetical protein
LGTLPEEIKVVLQGIFAQASQMSRPTEMLELLCQLHGRQSKDADNVVCDFDYNDQTEWDAKIKSIISDFIEAK